MTIADLRDICLRLTAVTEDIKWESHLCFSVGSKLFLITSPDEVPPTASFKVSNDDFESLIAREGIVPAPYLARYKWVKVDDISLLSRKQWGELLIKAHALIAEKLPAKVRSKLKLDN